MWFRLKILAALSLNGRKGILKCVNSKGKSFKGRNCASKMNVEYRWMQAGRYTSPGLHHGSDDSDIQLTHQQDDFMIYTLYM